ncbi:polymer-forming cytoskeletal protein [Aliidiomarina shirensis]|nr:polymer-forming cytoskeletal protein [Aliidiomarina shirensis]
MLKTPVPCNSTRAFNQVLGLILLFLISFSVFAADYTIPNDPPPGCNRSGGTVTCPNGLNLNWGDTISVGGNNRSLVIIGNANLQNAQINVGGTTSRLSVSVSGDLSTGFGFNINSALDVGGVLNTGSNNTFNASVTAGTINSGSSTQFLADISANSITTQSSTLIDGNVTVTNSFNGGSTNTITGSIDGGSITTANATDIGGTITGTTVTVGSANNVGGTITGDSISIQSSNTTVNGALNSSTTVFIGSSATINGPVTGTDITTNSPVTINGSVTASGDFTLASNSSVTGNVSATNVNIQASNSDVTGNVTATNTIDIGSGSGITGNATATNITLNYSNAYVTENATADETITNNQGSIGGNATAPEITNNGGNVGGDAICDDSDGQTPHSCVAGPGDEDDSCEAVTGFSEYGVIGNTQFEYGSGSTINGNSIDGDGNTPTPSGSVTTVPTEFPPFEPLQFPSNLVGGPDVEDQTDIAPGSYDTVEADDDEFISTTGGGTYYIEKLDLKNGSTIQFGPGDYFIEEIDMGNNVTMTVQPSGPVRLFIEDQMDGGNNIFINSGGNTANFMIFLYEDAEIDIGNTNNSPNSGFTNFNGVIYAPFDNTEVDFGNNNNIQGSIVSAGEVSVGSNTTFTYSQQTQQQVLEAFDCEPEDGEILYFQVRRPGSLVSCFTAPIEIRACANANCTELFEDAASVELTTSNATAEWANGDITSGGGTTVSTVSLSNGIGVVGLQNIPGGNTPFSVSSSTPNAVNPTQCFDPTGTTSGTCAVDFRTAGLLFVGANNFDPIPDTHAGVDFSVALRAVETNVNTGACEARVQGTQTVDIGVECVNPASCMPGQNYSIDGTNIGLNDLGSNANKQPVTLSFDANGIALLPHNYTDVGELRLHAELTLPAEPNANNPDINDPPVVLDGTGLNEFVVKPHTLVLQALDSDGDLWTATTNTGDGFQAAGSPFNVIIQSLNASGNATPNFGNESTPAGVQAAFDSVAFPTDGEDGTVTTGSAFVPDNVYPGAQRSNGVTWDEAGTVNLIASLTGDSYLGAGDVIAKPPSPVGRFYPDRFIVDDSSVVNACTGDGFSYMGHNEIIVSAIVHAVNTAGGITENYGRTNYPGSADINAVAANVGPADAPADDFPNRFGISWSADWAYGVMSVNEPQAVFQRLADEGPDGPYANLNVGLQIANEQDSRTFSGTDLTLATQLGAAAPLADELNLRYGRLVLENIAGPEDENLNVIMLAEYWDGNRFMVNNLDSCTVTNAVNLSIIDNPNNLVTGPDGISGTLENGELVFGDLFWEPANDIGEFEFEYQAPTWLQYPWVDNAGDPYANPRAFGSFGQYRGNDRIIYWLELR